MNIFHYAYNWVAAAAELVLLPAVWCHARRYQDRRDTLAQRLGYGAPDVAADRTGQPKIWIHAVSVGEVKAAETIVHALDAAGMRVSILLTTTTSTGQRHARRQLGHRVTVRYAPLDLWWAVKRFQHAHRPDLLVCMETELWPNWLATAHRSGIKTVFLNGRISSRSIRSYLRIRPLLAPLLASVDAFSMSSVADARRIKRLGAQPERVYVNGNVKIDALQTVRETEAVHGLKRLYAVDSQTPVFVAGSVRTAEADDLMDVCVRLTQRIPNLVTILAPRHIEKTPHFADTARTRKIEFQCRTGLDTSMRGRVAPLVILDTIGELRHVYSLATVAFCGASLVPLGGQNVLEAAVWGKPVLYGPSMEDFEEARQLLEACGGGICVRDVDALANRAMALLTHPREARRLGALARSAVLDNRGPARRHARVIMDLLADRPQGSSSS